MIYWAARYKLLQSSVPLLFTTNCFRTKMVSSYNSTKYRVIKKSLCTWWLQYRKLQVMFKVSHPPFSRHLLTRRTVFSKTVFSTARSTFRMYSVTAIFNPSIVWGFFEYTEFFIAPQRRKLGRRKIRSSLRPNGFRNYSVRKHIVQECHRHMRCMSTTHVFLASILSSIWLLGSRPPGPGEH